MALRKARPKKVALTALYAGVVAAFLLYVGPSPGRFRPGGLASPTRPVLVDVASSGDKNGNESRWCRPTDEHLLDLQQRHGLSTPFTYLRRIVRFKRSADVQRQSLTGLPQRLLATTDFALVHAEPGAAAARHPPFACEAPLEVNVSASPFPQTVDASALMFGISSTYDRFTTYSRELLTDWSFWLTDGSMASNGGKLILMLLDATQEQLDHAKRVLAGAGIDADTYASAPDQPMAARNMALVPQMHAHPEAPRKQWFVLCDDDTFFPSMHALLAKLGQLDPSADMYVGGLSEDGLAVQKHGLQAFGGAGIFLSRSTAGKIAVHFAGCASEPKVLEADLQGDRLLRQCIQEHSPHMVLTLLDELWQLDFHGDPSGFYEAGLKPLSLHHYRTWHESSPADYARLAYVCGEDCTLQRFRTADDFILSGYSVARYPRGIDFDPAQVERTFDPERDTGTNFDARMGKQRGRLAGTGRKMAWKLREAALQEDGSVLQTYVLHGNDTRWRDEDGRPMSEHHSVVELVWVPG